MKPSQPSAAFWAIVVVAAVFVAYLLSFGPAFYVAAWLDNPALMAFYEPISWIAREFQPLGDVMYWYLELWGIHVSC